MAATPAAIGSYPPGDVTFLLKDLSHLIREEEVAARERALRAGAHYSESLPVEYRPTPDYLRLFHALLEERAGRVAVLVGVLADEILDRSPEGRPVLVSLARAGTPIGVLLRRRLVARHGVDAAHYAISIIRDRGIDRNAVGYLLGRHRPEEIRFVDGWTGKGVIARELARECAALASGGGPRLDPTLAVLADPGHATDLFATREDVLIPSACLNSTVSGLVSRTVLNAALVGPDDFHGAKWYRELAGEDVSRLFIDRVMAELPGREGEIAAARAALAGADPPDGRGWREVERIQRVFGLADENLVKPGVGETTRVLLRRVPWKVLVRPDARAGLRHLLLLAADRGVEVVDWPDMSYSACGLIEPGQ